MFEKIKSQSMEEEDGELAEGVCQFMSGLLKLPVIIRSQSSGSEDIRLRILSRYSSGLDGAQQIIIERSMSFIG